MTTDTDTKQRIYVASLSDYNAGILHGVWIDLDEVDDIDDLWARVNAMLAASPEGNSEFSRRHGMKAEEWAIHDFEGFGAYRLSEYENLEQVLLVASLIREKGLAFAAWLDNDHSVLDGADYGDLAEAFDEAYAGEWDSIEDYAREFVSDCGWNGVSGEELEKLDSYLDWESIARELEHDGWTWTTADHNVVFFRNV